MSKRYSLRWVTSEDGTISESDDRLQLEQDLEDMLLHPDVFEIEKGDKFEVVDHTTGEVVYESEY